MRARCPTCGGPLRDAGDCRLCVLDMADGKPQIFERQSRRRDDTAVARNRRWGLEGIERLAAHTVAIVDYGPRFGDRSRTALANDTANSPATSTWLPGAPMGYCRTAAERTGVVSTLLGDLLSRPGAVWLNLGRYPAVARPGSVIVPGRPFHDDATHTR